MRAFDVAVPTTAQSLKELLNDPPLRTTSIGFQAPIANTETIFFGDKSVQPAELKPEGSALLEVSTFDSIYIKGTSGDKLTVLLFDA